MTEATILNKLLKYCCAGALGELQTWADTCSLTANTVRDGNNNWALRLSCQKGHLAVAQWLTARFGLTAEDARANRNEALRLSCQSGHLAVAKWLAKSFGLMAEDARADENEVLRQGPP